MSNETEIKDFIKWVNSERLANKNKWVTCSDYLNGHTVVIRLYNTWIQRIEINTNSGILTDSGIADISVGDFKNYLKSMLERYCYE
jgi:hypothetical protein